MRFVSYAQNFEDVMLWRALQHVRGGFYIDVGANDPVKDSVTRAFYERGWRGINVEPVASHHADLERDRPLDVNLRCALGASNEGAIDLWECEVPGLATTDAAVVEQHVREGRQGAWQRVPVQTLATVCAEHAGGKEIHFLKIDVEGGEEAVLAGADFSRFRPWIVVVEATRPNSREQKHEQWEHLLTGRGYRFAYADGLNRFYVAQEHQELMAALAHPPNVFDRFVVAQQFNVEQEAQELKTTVGRLDAQVRALDDQAAKAADSAAQAAERARQLQELADRLDTQLVKAAESAALANERALQFSDRATQAETRTQEWVGRAVRAETELRAAEEMVRSTQRLVSQRDAQLEQARLIVQQVYASSSWRVTRPLRWVSAWWKGERRGASPFAAAAGGAPAAGSAGEQRQHGAGGPGAAVGAPHLPPRAQRALEDIHSGAAGTQEGR